MATPQWRCSTASSMESRFCSRPRVTRRGLASGLSSTSAWTSTSSGRVPSRVTRITLPATSLGWRDRKMAEGLLTSLSPRSVMAKTPSSLTAPNRFLIERISLNWLPDSPSK